MPGVALSRMEFCVFAEKSEYSKSSHGQKNRAHYFQPQLVRNAGEGAERRAGTTLQRVPGATAAGLLAGNPRHDCQLPQG